MGIFNLFIVLVREGNLSDFHSLGLITFMGLLWLLRWIESSLIDVVDNAYESTMGEWPY